MSAQEQAADKGEKSRVAAGAGLVSVARLMGGILNLLVIVALTRLLPQSVFALVAIVYLLQETVTAIGSLDLSSALFYFVPKLGDRAARALGSWTAGLLLALAVPFALLLWLGGPSIAQLLGKHGLDAVFPYVALYILADFPGQAMPGYLLGRRSYVGFFLVTLLFYGSRFASLVVPAALGVPFEGILTWFVGVAFLRLAAFAVYLVFFEKGGLRREGWSVGELFGYGIPLSMSTIVGKLDVQLDKYLIAVMCSASVFAVYTVGATEIPLVPSVAYSVTTALVPTLIALHERRDTDGFLSYWHGSVVKVSAIMMPVFFFFLFLAGPLVRLMFSAAYTDARIPFRVFLCLLPLRLCAYGAVVRALGETKPVFYSSIAGLAANAALVYPFYALFGLPGPAMASVTSQLVAIVWLLSSVRRRLDVSWARVFPYWRVGKAFVVAGLSALPLLGVGRLLTGDVAQVGAAIPLFLAIYLVAGRLTGVVTRADLTYLADLATLRVFKNAAAKGGEP
jgi:O-antigen/teichoic acid export membrane protein